MGVGEVSNESAVEDWSPFRQGKSLGILKRLLLQRVYRLAKYISF